MLHRGLKNVQTYQSKSALGVLGRVLLNKHIRPGSDNGGVDETQEEETADQGTNCLVLGIRIFSPRETPNLLAYPSNTIWRLVHSVDNRVEEVVGELDQLTNPTGDDGLDLRICGSLFCSDATRGQTRSGTADRSTLSHHSLVYLERVDLEVDIAQLASNIVDLFG
jgi:hypothetical protein